MDMWLQVMIGTYVVFYIGDSLYSTWWHLKGNAKIFADVDSVQRIAAALDKLCERQNKLQQAFMDHCNTAPKKQESTEAH